MQYTIQKVQRSRYLEGNTTYDAKLCQLIEDVSY